MRRSAIDTSDSVTSSSFRSARLLFAGADRLYGGGFHQPANAAPHALGQAEDALTDFPVLELGRLTQWQNGFKTQPQLFKRRIVFPSGQLGGGETVCESN